MKKNNKNLILEISTIQRLMTGKLILEQWGSIIDDVINIGSKIVGKLPDNVDNLISRLSKTTNEEDAIKILADIAKQSDEMSGIIVPKIMSTISDVERKTINDVKTLFKNEIDNGLDPDYAKSSAENWVNQNIKTDFDGVKDIIKKDILDYIDNVAKKSKTKPKPIVDNPKPNDITGVSGQNWEQILPLSSDELTKLEKLYRQKGLGQSFFRSMRQFSQRITDMITKQVALMDETLSLMKTLDETTNAAQKTDILRRIGDNIENLTKSDKDNYKIIDEWIDTNVPDYKLKSKLRGIEGYQKAAKIFDGSTLGKWKENYKGLLDRRRAMLIQVNSMLNPLSWFPGIMRRKFGDSGGYGAQVAKKWLTFVKGPEYGEFRRFLYSGQTQKWKGIGDFMKEFGVIPGLTNVAKEFAWSYISLAVMYAFVDYVTDILGNQVRNVEYLNDYGFVQNQIKSYDEHINKENTNVNTLEKPTIGLLNFLGDMSNYSMDYFKDLSVAFPGLVDDFLNFWFDLRNDKINEENIDKLNKQGEKLKEQIKTEQKKLENTANNIVNNETTSKINIKEDIKSVAPCLFTGGWDVSLVNVDGRETYVTHNSDWTEKYYLDVVKNNNTTTVYYKGTNKNPCR